MCRRRRATQKSSFSPQKLCDCQVQIGYLPSFHIFDPRFQHFPGSFESRRVLSCCAHDSDPLQIITKYLSSLFGERNAPGNNQFRRNLFFISFRGS